MPIISNQTIVADKYRFSYPINDVWLLDLDKCPNQCNDNGKCEYGRCICKNGYFGIDCSAQFCKNSFCINDLDDWSYQKCFHCSGHGKLIL